MYLRNQELVGWAWCAGPGEGLEGPPGRDTPGHTQGVSRLWALPLGPQASTCPSSSPPQMRGPGPSRRDPPPGDVSREEEGRDREAVPTAAGPCVRDPGWRVSPPHLAGGAALLSHVLDEGDEQLLSPAQRRPALTQGQGGLGEEQALPSTPAAPGSRLHPGWGRYGPGAFGKLQIVSPPL